MALSKWLKVMLPFLFGIVIGGFVITPVDSKPEIATDNSSFLTTITTQQKIIDILSATIPSPQGISSLDSIEDYTIAKVSNTNSMLPTMNENSTLLLSKELVNIGDIVVYQNGDDLWVHRIIGEQNDYWLCQGDNNRGNNQIEYIPKNDVLFRVMAILY